MKYVALNACRKSGRTDIIHSSMFHGEAEREDAPFPNDASHSLGDDFRYPMQIDMCGVAVPPIFMPGCSLVVSRKVQTILAEVKNIAFAPVQFRKLVNFPYRAGDFSYYDTPAFRKNPYKNRSDKLLERLPDDPKLHIYDGMYHEVVVPNMYTMLKEATSVTDLKFHMPHAIGEEVEMSYSPHVLEKCPMFWAMAVLISQPVFQSIEQFIDWDYFTSATLDL